MLPVCLQWRLNGIMTLVEIRCVYLLRNPNSILELCKKVERLEYKITAMNSEGEDGENNRLTVDYSVVLANIMNNVDKSQNYYVSSGVVIGDYYNEVTISRSMFSLNSFKQYVFHLSPSTSGCPRRP